MTTRVFKRTNRKLKKSEPVQATFFFEQPARPALFSSAAASVPAFTPAVSATVREVLFPEGFEPTEPRAYRRDLLLKVPTGSRQDDAIAKAATAVRAAIDSNPRRIPYHLDDDAGYAFWHCVGELPTAVMALEDSTDAKAAALIHAVTNRADFNGLRRPVTAAGIATVCAILEKFVDNSSHLFASQANIFEEVEA